MVYPDDPPPALQLWLAAVLEARLIETNTSQHELARQTGMAVQAVNALMRGRKRGTLTTWSNLLVAVGLDPQRWDRRPDVDWWTIGQVASYLGVTVNTVGKYEAKGFMPPASNNAGIRRWNPEVIIRWHTGRPHAATGGH